MDSEEYNLQTYQTKIRCLKTRKCRRASSKATRVFSEEAALLYFAADFISPVNLSSTTFEVRNRPQATILKSVPAACCTRTYPEIPPRVFARTPGRISFHCRFSIADCRLPIGPVSQSQLAIGNWQSEIDNALHRQSAIHLN